MQKVLGRLDSVRQKIINSVSLVDPDLYAQRPAEGEWSVAEIIHHLALVEERVTKDLELALARPPQRVALLRRLIPISMVSVRFFRVKAPKAVRPLQAPERDAALENLQRARSALRTLCDTHGKDRFRQVVFKHPVLGDLDGVATVSFVGYHEQRHYKQIRDVLRKLNNGKPKTD